MRFPETERDTLPCTKADFPAAFPKKALSANGEPLRTSPSRRSEQKAVFRKLHCRKETEAQA